MCVLVHMFMCEGAHVYMPMDARGLLQVSFLSSTYRALLVSECLHAGLCMWVTYVLMFTRQMLYWLWYLAQAITLAFLS